jgi:capsular polysaccharide biosynthesis protein
MSSGNAHARTRRWSVVLLMVLLGALGGVGYSLLATPTYTAQAFVVVSANPVTGDRRDVSFAQAYGRVISQPDVARVSSAAVNAPIDEVIRSVQARTSPDAPIIELTGNSTDALRVAAMVNAVANRLVAFAGERQKDTGVRLSVLSLATPPSRASSPVLSLNVAVGTAAGVLLGGLIALAMGNRGGPEPAVRHQPEPGYPAPQEPGYPAPQEPGYPAPQEPSYPAPYRPPRLEPGQPEPTNPGWASGAAPGWPPGAQSRPVDNGYGYNDPVPRPPHHDPYR